MAYTRTQWVEQETPLSAQNMNNIEDGIEELQSTKVDKVSGKGLSDQNYTAAEKTKLAGIAEGAQVNPGNASSSAAGLMSAADKSKLDGVQAGAQINRTYNAVTGKPQAALSPGFGGTVTVSQVSQDANGQVSVTDREITMPNSDASTSAHGLMSAADKTKLNNIEAGAQVNRTYTAVTGYPTERAYPGFGGSFSVSQVSQDETGQVTLTRRLVEIPNRAASTSVPGLMSAADKARLDSIVRPFVASSRASVTVQPKLSAEIIYDIPVETVGTGYTSAVLEGIVLPAGLCIGNIQRTVSDGSITAIKVTVTNASGDTRTVPLHSRAMVLLVKSSY